MEKRLHSDGFRQGDAYARFCASVRVREAKGKTPHKIRPHSGEWALDGEGFSWRAECRDALSGGTACANSGTTVDLKAPLLRNLAESICPIHHKAQLAPLYNHLIRKT